MAKSLCPTADCVGRMFPAVDETITPLPRHWSSKDKSSILGLSQNNLMVHYKGSLFKSFSVFRGNKCFFVVMLLENLCCTKIILIAQCADYDYKTVVRTCYPLVIN